MLDGLLQRSRETTGGTPIPVVPKVNRRPLISNFQDNSANLNSFGASSARALQGFGRAVERAGDVVGDIALREQVDYNEAQAKNLETEFKGRMRDLLYGEEGFYNKQGVNAVESAPAVQEQVEKLKRELSAKAENEAIGKAFSNAALLRQQTEYDRITKYVSNQKEVAADTASEARIKESIDDASAAWNDPTLVSQSEAILRRETLELADRKGWAPEVTQSKLEEANTALYAQMIKSAMASGNDGAAISMLNKYETKMDGPVVAQLRNQTRAIGDLAQAQRSTDSIMAQNLNFEQSLEAARQIEDPKLRDAVVNRVKTRWAEKKAAQSDSTKTVVRGLFAGIYDQENPVSFDTFAQQNPELALDIMDDPQLMGRIRLAEQRAAERRLFAEGTDGKTLNDFTKLSEKERAEADLTQIRGLLTSQEYAEAVDIQKGAIKKRETLLSNPAPYNQGYKALKRLTPSLNWNKEKATQENIEQQNILEGAMDAWIANELERKGRPTDEEIQQEAQRLATEINVDSGWPFGLFDDEAFAAEIKDMTPQQLRDVTISVDNIPRKEVAEIRGFLSTYGQETSEENIQDYFKAMMLNDEEAMARILGFERDPLTGELVRSR